jgi:hypothetical protein
MAYNVVKLYKHNPRLFLGAETCQSPEIHGLMYAFKGVTCVSKTRVVDLLTCFEWTSPNREKLKKSQIRITPRSRKICATG